MNVHMQSPVSLLRSSAATILFAVAVAALVIFAGRTEARGEELLGVRGGSDHEALPAELALGLGLSRGGDLQFLDFIPQEAVPEAEAGLPEARPTIRSSARDEVAGETRPERVDAEVFPHSSTALPLLVSAGTAARGGVATVVPMRPGSIQPVGVPLSRFRSALPVGTPPSDRLFRSIR